MNTSEKNLKRYELEDNSDIFRLDLEKIRSINENNLIDIYRFIRIGNDIYVANNDTAKQHKDIMELLGYNYNEVSDGGFFSVMDNEITIDRFSAHLESKGITEETIGSGRNRTVEVIDNEARKSKSGYIASLEMVN